jgi:hypothetical protein
MPPQKARSTRPSGRPPEIKSGFFRSFSFEASPSLDKILPHGGVFNPYYYKHARKEMQGARAKKIMHFKIFWLFVKKSVHILCTIPTENKKTTARCYPRAAASPKRRLQLLATYGKLKKKTTGEKDYGRNRYAGRPPRHFGKRKNLPPHDGNDPHDGKRGKNSF